MESSLGRAYTGPLQAEYTALESMKLTEICCFEGDSIIIRMLPEIPDFIQRIPNSRCKNFLKAYGDAFARYLYVNFKIELQKDCLISKQLWNTLFDSRGGLEPGKKLHNFCKKPQRVSAETFIHHFLAFSQNVFDPKTFRDNKNILSVEKPNAL